MPDPSFPASSCLLLTSDVLTSEIRRPESKQNKKIDQDSVYQMYEEVYDMVARDLKPPISVVQRQTEISQISPGIVFIPGIVFMVF